MLVLSRKVGERIRIGDNVTITVVRINQGGVRLGIEAPNELPVVREELFLEIQREAEGPPADGAQERAADQSRARDGRPQ